MDDTFLRRMSAINAVLPGKKLGIEKERRGDCHGSRRRWPRADERISLSASHEMGRLSFLLYGFLVGTMRTLFFRRTTPLVVTKPISQRALSRPSFLPILLPLPSPPFRPLVNLFFRWRWQRRSDLDCTQADSGITLLRLARISFISDVILLDSIFGLDCRIVSYFSLKSTGLLLSLTLTLF